MHPRTRAERRSETDRVLARRLGEWRNAGWLSAECREISPEHRGWLKRHGTFGCGRARCGLCHGDKLAGKPSTRDVRQLMAAGDPDAPPTAEPRRADREPTVILS